MKDTVKLKEILLEERAEPLDHKVIMQEINNYSTLGEALYKEESETSTILDKIAKLSEQAGQVMIEQEEDWFNRIMVKKDSQRLRKVGGDIQKISEQIKSLRQEASGLYEDAGILLNRYFTIEGPTNIKKTLQKKMNIKDRKITKITEKKKIRRNY